MPTVRAASGASDANSRSTIQVGALPTGWQAGDFCLIIVTVGNVQTSFNNTGSLATGWTWITTTGNSNSGTGASFCTNIAYKILAGGDVWPGDSLGNGLGWSVSGRYAVVSVAIQPDASQTFVTGDLMNTAGTPTVQTTANNTFATPSYNAGSNTGLSVVLAGARAFANGATAISATPPTNWTEPANADQSTASGTNASSRQVGSELSGRAAQTGTISPGNVGYSQAGNNVTCNVYHLFVNGLAAGGGATYIPDTAAANNRARLIRASCW
jgi:hypothetical protein